MAVSLERIGDHAYGTSLFVFDHKLKMKKKLVEIIQLAKLFDDVDEMLENIANAFETVMFPWRKLFSKRIDD
jgi:phosphate uptake regulator